VGAIVRQAERSDHPAKCFGDMKEHCAIDRLCSLRGIFGDAVSAFYAVLDRYTLEDLVRNKESLHQVLFPIRRTRMMSAATIRKLRS
jgi:Rrf2 family nitric oxide-sensitive transcriptional repressor